MILLKIWIGIPLFVAENGTDPKDPEEILALEKRDAERKKGLIVCVVYTVTSVAMSPFIDFSTQQHLCLLINLLVYEHLL